MFSGIHMKMARILRQFFQIPHKILTQASSIRRISTTKCPHHNYEGDGKTTVTMLNREYNHLIMINSFSEHGFRLNNGIYVVGPMAVFPRTILQWNVPTIEDITPESLSLFALLEPKLDIFVLGTGDKRIQVRPEVLKFFQSHKISTEILSTEKACAIFNFLNVEGRCVAGAFVPPTHVTVYVDEEFDLMDVKKDEGGPYLM